MYFNLSLVFLLLFQLFGMSFTIDLNVNDSKAVKDAEFSLNELKKLSDSKIYESLKINKIISAEELDGIYHQNTILSLELESNYFKSGHSSEIFKVIVMRNKIDGSVSFAIDEFPQMDQLSIEKFLIQKIKSKRIQRDEIFRKIQIESLIEDKFIIS